MLLHIGGQHHANQRAANFCVHFASFSEIEDILIGFLRKDSNTAQRNAHRSWPLKRDKSRCGLFNQLDLHQCKGGRQMIIFEHRHIIISQCEGGGARDQERIVGALGIEEGNRKGEMRWKIRNVNRSR